jgi:hypothetical protein
MSIKKDSTGQGLGPDGESMVGTIFHPSHSLPRALYLYYRLEQHEHELHLGHVFIAQDLYL